MLTSTALNELEIFNTVLCGLMQYWKFSFIVSELVQVNPDNSRAMSAPTFRLLCYRKSSRLVFTEGVRSLQAMLSNRTVEENDRSNPCIEISDIKYEIFTVGHENVNFYKRIPLMPWGYTLFTPNVWGGNQLTQVKVQLLHESIIIWIKVLVLGHCFSLFEAAVYLWHSSTLE